MRVECARCGGSEDFSEDMPEETAIRWYCEHMLNEHPEAARKDPLVKTYVAAVARKVTPTNGALLKKKS